MRNTGNEVRVREELNRLGRPSVAILNREIARRERMDAYKRLIVGILCALTVAVAAVVLVTHLWIAAMQVEGESMSPLLQKDEIVLAMQTGTPLKNDVIAFYHNNRIFIKRVIATGGDRVDIDAEGRVSVNGTVLEEPYVSESSLGDCDIELPCQVPSGMVFVMGDNRPVSKDSRSAEIGMVDKENIIGKLIFRIWPIARLGSL
ncbi:MAG: signal peptidase I [Clostridiales bacterium]|nr:signal peptidase I [Clostridiales bacterium]